MNRCCDSCNVFRLQTVIDQETGELLRERTGELRRERIWLGVIRLPLADIVKADEWGMIYANVNESKRRAWINNPEAFKTFLAEFGSCLGMTASHEEERGLYTAAA